MFQFIIVKQAWRGDLKNAQFPFNPLINRNFV